MFCACVASPRPLQLEHALHALSDAAAARARISSPASGGDGPAAGEGGREGGAGATEEGRDALQSALSDCGQCLTLCVPLASAALTARDVEVARCPYPCRPATLHACLIEVTAEATAPVFPPSFALYASPPLRTHPTLLAPH